MTEIYIYMLDRHENTGIFFEKSIALFKTFSYLIETENSAETSLTTGQLFGYAVLKFFRVFVGSLAIGTAISIITALLFKVCINSRTFLRIGMDYVWLQELLLWGPNMLAILVTNGTMHACNHNNNWGPYII